MYLKGYTQKQLQIIFKVSKSTIHRIVKEKTWKDVKLEENISGEKSNFLKSKKIMDKILQKKEIPGMGKLLEQDLMYISLLKACHVGYNDVRQIYSDVTIPYLRSAYDYPQRHHKNFDSTLLGISKEDYAEFLGL